MEENKKHDTGMAKLMLSIAKTMPEEMLLEELKKAIAKYEGEKPDENKKHFRFYLQMAALRLMHEDESMEESFKSVDAAMVERNKLNNT